MDRRDVAIVKDEYGNELFFGETIGECQKWCQENGIDGKNGEYIGIGTFDEDTKYFELEDYSEIEDIVYTNDSPECQRS